MIKELFRRVKMINDYVLTEIRKAKQDKEGIPKGFPIFIIRDRNNSIKGIYANKTNAERVKEELSSYMWVRLDLFYVDDINYISMITK